MLRRRNSRGASSKIRLASVAIDAFMPLASREAGMLEHLDQFLVEYLRVNEAACESK